jgi:hypothetical protein
MLRRVYLLPIVLFWITMNVLLWRSEFAGKSDAGGAIPVNVVWSRILTAPDPSGLEVHRRGEKIGFVRWRPNVGEERRSGRVLSEDMQPEGQVLELTGYTIDMEGNIVVEELSRRLRLEFRGEFETNNVWQTLVFRIQVRPAEWEIRARKADQTLAVTMDDAGSSWTRTYKFSEFRDPAKLLGDLGYPLGPMLAVPGSPVEEPQELSPGLGLTWTARNDWLKVGQTRVRVYRLETVVMDQYRATIFISRVGELLRVELPGDILLINDAFIM